MKNNHETYVDATIELAHIVKKLIQENTALQQRIHEMEKDAVVKKPMEVKIDNLSAQVSEVYGINQRILENVQKKKY